MSKTRISGSVRGSRRSRGRRKGASSFVARFPFASAGSRRARLSRLVQGLLRVAIALFVGIVVMSGIVAERAATAAQVARGTGVAFDFGGSAEEAPVEDETSSVEAEAEVETEEENPGSGLETDELCDLTDSLPPPAMSRLGWVVPTTHRKPVPPPLDPEDVPSER